jgi:hypothetical protein
MRPFSDFFNVAASRPAKLPQMRSYGSQARKASRRWWVNSCVADRPESAMAGTSATTRRRRPKAGLQPTPSEGPHGTAREVKERPGFPRSTGFVRNLVSIRRMADRVVSGRRTSRCRLRGPAYSSNRARTRLTRCPVRSRCYGSCRTRGGAVIVRPISPVGPGIWEMLVERARAIGN